MAKVNYIELNKALKPINKNTVKAIERNSARFIYVDRNRVAKCERCESEFALANAKHRDLAKCPKCHRTFEVIHTWRKSKNESIHWEVTGKALNDTQFVIRYYLVTRVDGKIVDSGERARLFINTDKKETCKMELDFWDKDWKKSGSKFFREYFMSYQQNRYCCLDGTVRETFFKEVQKLSVFKYFDLKSIWNNRYYASAICYISQRAPLYEKLQKVGLSDLISADLNTYSQYDEIKFNRKETELTKMLGINKTYIGYLKKYSSLHTLRLLQALPNLNEREFMAYKDCSIYDIESIGELAKQIGCTLTKLSTYISNQKATIGELKDYINKLKQLGYDIKDHSYSMPKDFVKEMARITFEEIRAKNGFDEKRNALINEISKKLRNTPQLKEFFNGSQKYSVYVPMSEEEFIAEGIAQHNCVGRMGYAKKVANNETLIFFVRESDKPHAPFITLEYRQGRIIQAMLDHNVRVKETSEVYNFCSRLATTLNKCNILSA